MLCQPVVLKVEVNTKLADWWCEGTNASTLTMISTPTMCHHTLTLLSRATSRMPNWFSSPCTSSTPAKSAIVTQCAVLTPHSRFSSALMKNAQPKAMPAVIATWPRKLNQPVNQDQAGQFLGASLAAQ